ncbi:MAG: hypothetical protein HUJ61_01590, partial [Bacilli bacterium]|nr:hypothetical protein [Bacilli bacterium]
MHLYYKGDEILTVNVNETLPIWTVANGPCIALENNENFNISNFTNGSKITLNRYQYFGFKCYDEYKNKIDKGGEIFYSIVKYHDDFGHSTSIESEVIDNGNGYYLIKFIPESYGKHVVNLNIERRNGQEKYGDEIILDLKPRTCQTGNTLCPNIDKCVSKLFDCIVPPNDCPKETPFECLVNGQKACVASQVQCDCPEGYFKCKSEISKYLNSTVYWPGYCVPSDRTDMCPRGNIKNSTCKIKLENSELSIDGKCRVLKESQAPNQRVCPPGKILCADFSCRDSYDECEKFDECPTNYYRCSDQTCQDDYLKCPDMITCKDE